MMNEEKNIKTNNEEKNEEKWFSCEECAMINSMQPCEACPNFWEIEKGTIKF